MLPHTIHDAIIAAAKLWPGSRAFLGAGTDVSYTQLCDDIDHVCRFVQSQGLSVGDLVLIQLPPNYMHSILILALDRLGITSMSDNASLETLGLLSTLPFNLGLVISNEPKPDDSDINWQKLDQAALVSSLPIASDFTNSDILNDNDPTRVVRLAYTSGTTGGNKLVAIDRANIIRRICYRLLYTEGMGTNRHLLGFSLTTVVGYTYLLMIFYRGATAVPSLSPQASVSLIDRFQISHAWLSPVLFQRIIQLAHNQQRNFSSLHMTTTAGAPLNTRLVRHARAIFGNNIWNSYGSTEVGSVAIGHVNLVETDPTMIGPVLPFTTVEIVDDDDNVLPVGSSGNVRITNDLTLSSYANNDVDNDKYFRDGFFYTGDLGRLDNQGYLRIMGRIDDVINIRGGKKPPEAIERPITGLPGVQDVAVIQADFGQGIIVCAAVVLADGHSIKDVSQQINENMGANAPQQLRAVKAIPRNNMGKIMRNEIKQQLVD